MKAAYLKLLLNHEYYQAIKHKLVDAMFDAEEVYIWETIKWGHTEFKRDLNVKELYDLIKARNPTLTTVVKTNIASIIDDIENAEDIKEDSAKFVLSKLWKHHTALHIANYGIELSEGKKEDLFELKSHLERIQDDWLPIDFTKPIPTDISSVVQALKNRSGWTFNIPALGNKVGPMSGGDFVYLLARPEVGKTGFVVNMIAGPNGFAEQGANVHGIFNEEPAIRTMMRAISSQTGMLKDEIEADINKASDLWSKVSSNITFVDDVTMTLGRLDAYCRRFKPDVLVVDQLDRVSASGEFASSHERLGEIYSKFREICKLHNTLGIGVSQASAEAEGKTVVTYFHSEGSRTAKGATADLVIGLGMSPITDESSSQENYIRYVTASKNKLSGWHGTIACKIVPQLSRYED